MGYTGKEGKLFIMAEFRSGSTLLMNTLSSHPDINLQGKILNTVENGDAAKYTGCDETDFRECPSQELQNTAQSIG
jgi:hypothetical protein